MVLLGEFKGCGLVQVQVKPVITVILDPPLTFHPAIWSGTKVGPGIGIEMRKQPCPSTPNPIPKGFNPFMECCSRKVQFNLVKEGSTLVKESSTPIKEGP